MARQVSPEEHGVSIALEKICTLESRLRQAIQSTHTLHRSFGQGMNAVDKEREALLYIREHLELLEDKLREYRTMAIEPKRTDDKAVALSQLDGLRKDLLRGARDRVDYVLYNKDVVKDILAFADTGAGDETLPDVAPEFEAALGAFRTDESASCSAEGSYTDDEYGEYYDSFADLPSSTGPSPYRKQDLQVVLPEREDLYSFPAPASTPSMVPHSQSTKEYIGTMPEIGTDSIPNLKASSTEYQRRHEDPRELIGAAHVGFSARNSKAGSPYGSQKHGHASRPQQPYSRAGSYVSSSPTPRQEDYTGGLSGQQDENLFPYGGKLSFKPRETHKEQASGPSLAPPLTPKPSEHPRIISEPSLSESQARSRPESNSGAESLANSAQEDVIQPTRQAMFERASLRSKAEQPGKKQHLEGLVRCCSAMGDFLRGTLSGAIIAGTLFTILKAVRKSEFRSSQSPDRQASVPQLSFGNLQRARDAPASQRQGFADSPGRPRADGHLVPDWMHKSNFSSTKHPPVGSLTSTEGPPVGEMFPVIPPPTIMHVKG